MENRLEKQFKFLNSHPEIGCFATATRAIGADLKDLFKLYQSNFDIESRLIFKGNFLCQSSVMLRKSILDKFKIRYKNEYVPAEDYAFWLDLVGHTQFSMLPEVLTVYRSHLGNISHRKSNIQIEKAYLARKKAIEKYCEISAKDKIIWEKYLKAEPLEKSEFEVLLNCLEGAIKTLVKKGYAEADLIELFKGKFKKLYRKTRTIRGQYLLFNSKLNDFFKLSCGWRLLYFITRGIL